MNNIEVLDILADKILAQAKLLMAKKMSEDFNSVDTVMRQLSIPPDSEEWRVVNDLKVKYYDYRLKISLAQVITNLLEK